MNIKDLFKSVPEIKLRKTNMPNHVAILMKGTHSYASENNMTLKEAFEKEVSGLKRFVASTVKLDIPIVTFGIQSYRKGMENFSEATDLMESYFETLLRWDFLHENKIKVYVIGKWYDLPGRVVDKIKKLISDTKDYDSFFMNLCVNYNGQEEILDSCRLIARSIRAERLDPESVSLETIKENIYTSYFIPPDLMIITGKEQKLDGFMLWDCSSSTIYFADSLWPDFGKNEFLAAVDFFQKKRAGI